MSTPEGVLEANIRLAWGRAARHCRMFRNPSGQYWAGRLVKQVGSDVHLSHAHKVQAGLHPGAGDEIGWTTITITQEMVGQKIAVFTSGEVKVPSGRVEPDQQKWADAINAAGGFAAIIRSEDDALRLVRAL